MHRLFRSELDSAIGVSEFVIAQNIDIRGFSDWSLQVDSAQTALYIKKVYAKLIDRYFANASFVKPTGDGLLVVEAFEEAALNEVATRTVQNAIEIVQTFPELCSDEDMINFPVPGNVGIGISRGTASRLASADRTLDYSGRVLNLASRLMDLARPRGVVFDDGYGINLLPKELAEGFHAESAYLKGVAESQPLAVHCWPDEVEIPAWHQKPLNEEQWEHKQFEMTLKEIRTSSFRRYRVELTPPPLYGAPVEAEVSYPGVTPSGRKATAVRYMAIKPLRHEAGGLKYAQIDLDDLDKKLTDAQMKPPWKATVKISYKVR
ncbi:MAG TPA: hypothetical protein VNN15_00050 [Solirubrobacterales bacterium]|nr:hypothetical protein [Solirubrobacterales bacterium]